MPRHSSFALDFEHYSLAASAAEQPQQPSTSSPKQGSQPPPNPKATTSTPKSSSTARICGEAAKSTLNWWHNHYVVSGEDTPSSWRYYDDSDTSVKVSPMPPMVTTLSVEDFGDIVNVSVSHMLKVADGVMAHKRFIVERKRLDITGLIAEVGLENAQMIQEQALDLDSEEIRDLIEIVRRHHVVEDLEQQFQVIFGDVEAEGDVPEEVALPELATPETAPEDLLDPENGQVVIALEDLQPHQQALLQRYFDSSESAIFVDEEESSW